MDRPVHGRAQDGDAGWAGQRLTGHDDGVVLGQQHPVRRHPGIQDPGGFQCRLQPGPMVGRQGAGEVHHLPQGRAGTAQAGGGIARVRRRRRLVAACLQPHDLLRQVLGGLRRLRQPGVQLRAQPAESVGGHSGRVAHGARGRVGAVGGGGPGLQRRDHVIGIVQPQLDKTGQVEGVLLDEPGDRSAHRLLRVGDALGDGLRLRGQALHLGTRGPHPLLSLAHAVNEPLQLADRLFLAVRQLLRRTPDPRQLRLVGGDEVIGLGRCDAGGLGLASRRTGGRHGQVSHPAKVAACRVGLLPGRAGALFAALCLACEAVPFPRAAAGVVGQPLGLLAGPLEAFRVTHLRALLEGVAARLQQGPLCLQLFQHLLGRRELRIRRGVATLGLAEVAAQMLVAAVCQSWHGGLALGRDGGVPAVMDQEARRRLARLRQPAQGVPLLVQAAKRLGDRGDQSGTERRQRLGEGAGQQLLIRLLGQLRLA